jgi:cob(I)alamin adenosyltransferase
MKLYTRTGDTGTTGLYGGERRKKSDLRVSAYGSVDELQAFLGLACAHLPGSVVSKTINSVQQDLFIICCELSRTETKPERNDPVLDEARVTWLESAIDDLDASLPALTAFIVQGGSPEGAQLHVSRAVSRRAEREVVLLADQEEVSAVVIRYLNRLSDYLFVAARWVNQEAGMIENHVH